MEFAKTIAIAPTAPTAPPSYDESHQSNTFQQDSYQRQIPQQSTYPHSQPNPTIIVNNTYPHPHPNQNPGHYPTYQRPGQIVITQAPTSIVRPGMKIFLILSKMTNLIDF